jgi:hypothetical protein
MYVAVLGFLASLGGVALINSKIGASSCPYSACGPPVSLPAGFALMALGLGLFAFSALLVWRQSRAALAETGARPS